MKIVKTLVLACTCVAALGLGGEEPSKVPFALGPGHFKEGDQIVIKEVLCTSTSFTLGDKVVVRGQYGLKSQEGATLCLLVASNTGNGGVVLPQQTKHIRSGAGEFELSTEVNRRGYLHLCIYPAAGGAEFGGVSFGTERQMSGITNMNISGKWNAEQHHAAEASQPSESVPKRQPPAAGSHG